MPWRGLGHIDSDLAAEAAKLTCPNVLWTKLCMAKVAALVFFLQGYNYTERASRESETCWLC